jgi:hypothetical protein
MSVDITVVEIAQSKDMRNFQPTLWFSSAVDLEVYVYS